MYDDGYREIVWIKDAYRLVDAESYERTYSAAEGRTLSAGYYIAQWPPGTTNPHFLHDELRFIGPFESRHSAAAALDDHRERYTGRAGPALQDATIPAR
jgi:hypothetical protein